MKHQWPDNAPTDKELLDWLQENLDRCQYTGRVIFRWSLIGHGIRLQETSMDGAKGNVREAIMDAMEREGRC